MEGTIFDKYNSSIDVDLLIDKKMVFKNYGWKVEIQVKEQIIEDDSVEVKQSS